MCKNCSLIRVLGQVYGLPVCCSCKKKIKINDVWADITLDDYKKLMVNKNLSHVYCPECFMQFAETVKLDIAKLKPRESSWE
jgi:hypothetical protein